MKRYLKLAVSLLLLLTACDKQQVVNHANYAEYQAFCTKSDIRGKTQYCMFYNNRGVNAFDLNNGGE